HLRFDGHRHEFLAGLARLDPSVQPELLAVHVEVPAVVGVPVRLLVFVLEQNAAVRVVVCAVAHAALSSAPVSTACIVFSSLLKIRTASAMRLIISSSR